MEQTSSLRVDYSELVDSLMNGNDRNANRLLKEVIPKLEEYLKVVMGAGRIPAKECAQEAFIKVYDQILKGNIKNRKYILSYMLTTCRNEYLRYRKKESRYMTNEDGVPQMVEPAQQIENLLDDERQQVLKECLDELDPESRKFIVFFIRNPDATTKQASKHFKLTGANVRTRKSRLVAKLHEAYKEKVNR